VRGMGARTALVWCAEGHGRAERRGGNLKAARSELPCQECSYRNDLDRPRTIGVRLVSLHVTDVQPFPDENEEEEERTTACGQQRSAYNTDPVLSFLQAGYGG